MKFAITLALVLAAVKPSVGSDVKDAAAPAPVARATSQPVANLEVASAPPAVTVTTVSAPAVKPEPAVATFAKPMPLENRHLFFDWRNCAALAAMGAALTGDALSTQKGLGLPGFREINPIARPFVQNRPGAALYSAASFAFLGGGMYLAHKTNHHKLERILPFAVAGWEGLLTFHNYHLISSSVSSR